MEGLWARRPPCATLRLMATPLPDLNTLFRDAFADLLLRPWFDRAAVEILGRWYFPLSRAWAAARGCDGTVEDFATRLHLDAPPRWLCDGAIARVQALDAAHEQADSAWQAAVFSESPPAMDIRRSLENARHEAAHRLMTARGLFAPLHLARRLPPVHLDLPEPAAVEAAHGARLDDPATAFTPPSDSAPWHLSAPVAEADVTHHWLRRAAPRPYPDSPDDTLRARLIAAPDTPPEAPALVFAHGIGMEEEFWRGTAEPLRLLHDEGIRLVRAEAPWHSHRMARGQFGGEPVLGRGVLGLLDFMHGAVMEIGLLTAWARQASGGAPVAIGGISLGALTAQLAASVAHHWPAEMRPDAVFLVTPSASLSAVAYDGALTESIGLPAAMAAAGWTRDRVDRWRPLLEPQAPPACPGERVVLVLGEEDQVTPYAEGCALARNWRVPDDNIFRRARGHFTSSLGLGRDTAPFRRLAGILRDLP